MAGKKIGLVLALDNEKKFTQELSNAKKSANLLKTELTNVTKEFENNANSMQALQAKQQALTRLQDAYQKKLQAAKAGLDNATKKNDEQSKKLDELKKKLEEAEKAQKKMKESGDENSDAYKKQSQQVEELSEAVKQQNINALQAAGRVTDWNQRISESERQLRETNRALEQNEQHLREAEKATDHCATSIDEFGNEVGQAEDEVDTFGDVLKANLASEAIKAGVEKIAEGIKTVGSYALDVGMSFEAGMSEVAAISGATGSELAALTEKAKEMGATTKFSATESAEAFKYMAMAGWDSGQMLDGISGVMELAAASGEELGSVSDIVTDALSAFGMQAAESAHFSDILAMASSRSNTNVAMMGETFKYAAPVAGAMGYSAEDTAIAIGMMANSGIKASQAGTALRRILTSTTDGVELTGKAFAGAGQSTGQFVIETKNADGSMRSLNDIIGDMRVGFSQLSKSERAANAEAIAGKVGMSGLIAIMNETDANYKKLTDSIYNCEGATAKMAGTMQDNLKGKIVILQSALEGLGISAYEKFSDPLQDATEQATGVIEELTERMESGDLGRSFEDLAESLGNSADVLADVADGLVWIIEHGDAIIATLKGIASGMIMYKSITTITKVVNGLKAMYTALKAVESAQTALNLAQLANPCAALAAGVTALSVAFISYTRKSLRVAKTETQEMIEESEDLRESLKDVKKSADEQNKSWEKNVTKMEAQESYARDLTAELHELSVAQKKANQTEIEAVGTKARMQAIVEQLNSMYPSLNLVIDEQTGKLNKNTRQISENIEAMSAQAKATAAQERLAEIAEAELDAQLQLYEAQAKYESNTEKLNALEEERARITEEAVDGMARYGDQYGPVADMIELLDMDIASLNEEQEKLNKEIENTEFPTEEFDIHRAAVKNFYEDQKKAAGVEDDAADAADNLAESQKKAAASAGEFADAAGNIVASADAQKEALQSLQEKFEEIKSSIQQSMESKINLFDAFDGGDTLSFQTMEDNLDSYIEGLTNWKNNMQTLAGEIGDSMTAEFYDYLMELGPEGANLVQEMVNALDEGANEAELKGIAEKYTKAINEVDKASEELANTEATIKTVLGEMSDSSDIDFSNLIDSLDSAADAAAENGQVISQELEDAFLQTVESARQIGAEIPEGLAESMANGDVSVEEAIAALKGSIEAQFEFLSELAGDAGFEIPEDIRQGIEQGGDAAIQAIAKLQELLMQKQQEAEESFEKSGKENTEATGKGVESAKAEVASKTGGVMEEAARTANSYSNSFTEVGRNLMEGVAIGLNTGSHLVYDKVRQIMNQAKEEAKKETKVNSPSRVWRDEVGSPIAEGLALGIGNGEKDVRAASAGLAKASLDETKKELEIHSPSKKFKDQVGKQIGAGVAFGIKTSKKKSKKAAKKMAQEVAAAAQEAVENFKKNNVNKINQTLDDEEYMWKQLAKKAKKGSKAYRKEIKKLAKANLKEIEQQRKAEKLSTQESLLDNYKEYYELSAKAEMEYWDIARKQYEEGTDARLEADKKYFEARDSYNEQLKALQDDYKDKCDEINEKLLDDIEEQTRAYEEAFEQRKSAIKSAFGTFDEFTSEAEAPEKLLANMQSQVAGYELWMEQLEELEGKGILKNPFIEELRQMGPEAAATILSLNMMTEEQLRQAQEAWEEKDRLAESQAAKETEAVRLQSEERIRELRETAQRELDEQKRLYEEASGELSEALSAPLKELVEKSSKLGEDAVANMIKGLKEKVKDKKTTETLESVERQMAKGMDGLPAKGKTIGKDMLAGMLKGLSNKLEIKKGAKSFVEELEAAIKKEAGIRSPSRRFRDAVGRQIPAGVAQGIETGTKEAKDAGTDMVKAMLEQAAEQAKRQQAAIAEQMAAINASAGIAALDNLTAYQIPQQTNVTVNNSGVAEMVAGLTAEMRGVRNDIQRIKVVLDTGETVGALAPAIGNELTMQTRRW